MGILTQYLNIHTSEFWIEIKQEVDKKSAFLSSLSPSLLHLSIEKDPFDSFLWILSALKSGHHLLLKSNNSETKLSENDHPFQIERELSKDETTHSALLFLTSGSSGEQKLIKHTEQSLYQAIESYHLFFGPHTALGVLPLYHIGGLMTPLRALVSGELFELAQTNWREAIDRTDKKMVSLVPAQLFEILKNDFRCLLKFDLVLIGGAALSFDLWKDALNKKINISPSYGSTETGAVLAAQHPKRALERPSLFELLPKREVIIKNQHLIAKGHGIANEEWVSKDQASLIDTHLLEIHGRSDLTFISGGKNINPIIVEEKMKKAFSLHECFIIPIPDPKWGEIGVAFYQDFSRSDVKERIKDILLPHERPKHFFALSPKILSQKVSRQSLKKEALRLLSKASS